ncbi:hypothetical protein TRVL_01920 [Trypanosoma vivax]|nr:hypothetical protein TRVL_01920 [Trypanosoma vivax]
MRGNVLRRVVVHFNRNEQDAQSVIECANGRNNIVREAGVQFRAGGQSGGGFVEISTKPPNVFSNNSRTSVHVAFFKWPGMEWKWAWVSRVSAGMKSVGLFSSAGAQSTWDKAT